MPWHAALGRELSSRVLVLLGFVESAHRFALAQADLEPEADVADLVAKTPELSTWIEERHHEIVKTLEEARQQSNLAHLERLKLEINRAEAELHRRRTHEESLAGILERSLNEIYVFDPDDLHFLHVNEGASAEPWLQPGRNARDDAYRSQTAFRRAGFS